MLDPSGPPCNSRVKPGGLPLTTSFRPLHLQYHSSVPPSPQTRKRATFIHRRRPDIWIATNENHPLQKWSSVQFPARSPSIHAPPLTTIRRPQMNDKTHWTKPTLRQNTNETKTTMVGPATTTTKDERQNASTTEFRQDIDERRTESWVKKWWRPRHSPRQRTKAITHVTKPHGTHPSVMIGRTVDEGRANRGRRGWRSGRGGELDLRRGKAARAQFSFAPIPSTTAIAASLC